jgi:hypothetical protein
MKIQINMKIIKNKFIVAAFILAISCKEQNHNDAKEEKKSDSELIASDDNIYEAVIKGTTVRVFSVSDGDLGSCINGLKDEFQKSEFYLKEQRELKFKLMNNFTTKNTIMLKNVNLKLLLELLCQQYGCKYRVEKNEILFFDNTDVIMGP